jgi:hypothetical protein
VNSTTAVIASGTVVEELIAVRKKALRSDSLLRMSSPAPGQIASPAVRAFSAARPAMQRSKSNPMSNPKQFETV